MRLIVFTLEVCPNCEMLKEALNARGIKYDVIDAQSAEGITEMRVNGCFAMEMPVLMKIMPGDDVTFLEHSDLFEGGNVKESALNWAVMED